MTTRLLVWIIAMASFAAAASAQTSQPATTGPAMDGKRPAVMGVVSPEVNPDRRIRFRLRAAKASEVALVFAEGKFDPHAMTRDDEGVWSITLGPVEPEIYLYYFIVDGAPMIDHRNPTVKGGLSIDRSIVEVRGATPRFDQVQEVPHGSINTHIYLSTVQRMQRGICIYVPPEYYTQPARRFPVLYLWHGGGGSEQSWACEGRAGVILDNLIAQKRAAPMIVVMPNNVGSTPAPGTLAPAAIPEGTTRAANSPTLKRELLADIIPFVETNYRVLAGREDRAIAGLSGGGNTSITVGLNSLDMFATVGEFSAGMFGGASPSSVAIADVAPTIFDDAAATNKKLRLFYMSCGDEDPRLPFQKKVLQDVRSHQIKVTFAVFPGAHEWKVWRHALADFLSMVFQ